MTVDFCDHFWGEKNNGFDVLYHNMKYGQIASKELAEFFRERSSLEETTSKLLARIAKQAGNCSTNGTFAPLWQILKSSSEKLSSFHLQMVQRIQDMIKDVNKYCDEQHKRHKTVKDEEAGTLEVVQGFQATTVSLLKAKESYNQKCIEYERLKRDNASPKELEKSETKFKKAAEEYKALVDKYMVLRDDFEQKMTMSCQHFQIVEEEHLRKMKLFLDSYAQVLENGHALIGQVGVEFRQQCHEMTVDKLLEQFVQSKETGKERPDPVEFEEVDLSCISNLSSPDQTERITNGDKTSKKEGNKVPSSDRKSKPSRRTTSLLNLFMSSHGSSQRPLSPTPSPLNSVSSECQAVTANGANTDSSISRNTFRGSKWFLKSRRERKKKKKKESSNKEEKDINSINSGSGDSTISVAVCSNVYSPDLASERREDKDDVETPTSEVNTPEIDDEGFTIRPEVHADKSSFYSSSDSDSEEEKEKRIHIEIKPLSNGTTPLSASIDELRASVGGLTLSPTGFQSSNRRTPTIDVENPMKRSVSVSQQIGKNHNDLLNLSFQNPAPSSASTPTGAYGGGISSPASTNTSIQSPISPGQRSSDTTPTPTPTKELGELQNLFSELHDLPPALPPKHSHQNTGSRGNTPVGLILPRPPSRRALEPCSTSRGRMSPISPMSRADSVSSISSEFRSGSISVGSSRGPSPLTIGMSDTVPLAVAFQEIAHAYFKGTDESKCQVKLTGDMMISFPAGIVQVLANNPSPAVLSFRLKQTDRLENVYPNKQIISVDSSPTSDNLVYEFNMTALTNLLRKQAEQNPTASYFNIDILKYQIKVLPGALSTPLQLVAYWKCEVLNTDLRIDYMYNASAMIAPFPLLNISFIVPVDGGVTSMQSKPSGTWVGDSQRALWRFTELSQHSDNNGMGSVRARFELKSGPSYPSTIAAQFSCEGTTLSGADFELIGVGYRVSLVKRRFITGKYICETEPDMKNRYAPPP